MERPSGLSKRDAMTAVLSLPLAIGLGPSAGSAAVWQVQSRAVPLVAFFSRTGNTRVVAGQIRRARDADLFEIEPAAPYPEDYKAIVMQADQERQTLAQTTRLLGGIRPGR